MFRAVLLVALAAVAYAADFRVGAGIADVTGPVTEIDFMGYAFPSQTGQGMHTRLYSRAFIFEDTAGNRAVYVSLDLCMSMMSFKQGVVAKLKELGLDEYYTEDNVALSGIHTHSGPGAFSWFLLYDISMFGFDAKHAAAIVDGVAQSIVNAHTNLEHNQPAPLLLTQGLLVNASRNRSPSSYLANPADERAQYEQWGGDVDANMTVVRLADGKGGELGVVSFFAVHCTSMHNTNRLVSSDNKGYASYLFERSKNGNLTLPGQGAFVAGFGQSNLGDVSPNTLGAWCNGTVGGVYCGNNRSLCGGRNEECVSVGPAGFADDQGSTEIIGRMQYERAQQLYEDAATKGLALAGGVSYVHTWVNMSDVEVNAKFTGTGANATTCRPAVGFSFAAGTTDGPGAFNFYQGDNCTNCMPLWNLVKNFIKKPTKEQIACQNPKPILLDVGEIEPYPWVPISLPLQILRVGQLVIIVAPTELTTMAGRRLRATVHQVFADNGAPDVVVVIAGLANAYSGYTATYEEYEWQRYEAASTLYGPHQLAAYQQLYASLATALVNNKPYPPGVPHNNKSSVNFDLRPPVVVDTHPLGKPFGTVLTAPRSSYAAGETVNVSFVGANLRNDYFHGASYLTVERQNSTGWTAVMSDANWETKVHWRHEDVSASVVTCQWDIPAWMPAGTYRITHAGKYKGDPISSKLTPYSGSSPAFTVTAAH